MDQLQAKYDELCKRYAQLEMEYSENTIIQSMNDMKVRYDELLETSVSIFKYQSLQEKYDRIQKVVASSEFLIDHISNILKDVEEHVTESVKNKLYKARLELIILKEILEENS